MAPWARRRPQPAAALAAALLALLATASATHVAHAADGTSTPPALQLVAPWARVHNYTGPPLSQTLNGVGPALANATQTALDRGKAILTKYADVLRAVAIPVGIALCFFGYFLLAPVLFLAAFTAAGGACFVAVTAAAPAQSNATWAWLAIGAMLLGGSFAGFLAIRVLSVGMFAVGAALGVVFASAFRPLIVSSFPDSKEAAFAIAAAVAGLVLGLVALMLQTQMLVFSTAYAGACAAAFGIGKFAGHFPTEEALSEGNVDMYTLIYLGATLVCGTAGLLVQLWLVDERGGWESSSQRHSGGGWWGRSRRPSRRDVEWWDDGYEDDYYERRPLPPRKVVREPAPGP